MMISQTLLSKYKKDVLRTTLTVLCEQERGGSGGVAGERDRPAEILQSDMDAERWKLEVERVAPGLKVTVRVESRDWRAHLEQMHGYRSGIEESAGTTRASLTGLQAEISKTLEKIASREKYMNR